MKPISTCDVNLSPKKPSSRKAGSSSRLMRQKGFSWGGVKTERYKADDGTWSDVIRKTLIGGGKGEKVKFHLRYFEIEPGGRTTLECHSHEHVVIAVRGKGRCMAGGRRYEMGFLDTAYIAPDAPHQLINPYTEPFGFFCIVDARRDRPRPVKK